MKKSFEGDFPGQIPAVESRSASADRHSGARATNRPGKDRRERVAIVVFLVAAGAWLVAAMAGGTLAAWELAIPRLGEGISIFSFGRLATAVESAAIFGWGMNAAFGCGLWFSGRGEGCNGGFACGGFLYALVAVFWNGVVLLGTLAILGGEMQPLPALGFATPVHTILAVLTVLVAWPIGIRFWRGIRSGEGMARYYWTVAFLWLPVLYVSVVVLLVWIPLPAPAQIPVSLWFSGGLEMLWFVPVGLACAHEALSRRGERLPWSLAGFWCLVAIGGWAIPCGGPVPGWMEGIALLAGGALVIPALALTAGFRVVLRQKLERFLSDTVFRFAVLGFVGLVLALAAKSFLSIPPLAEFATFTGLLPSRSLFAFFAFSLLAIAAEYRILRRLLGRDWPWPRAVRWHFSLSVAGMGLAMAGLVLGALFRGLVFSDPEGTFESSVGFSVPFRWATALGATALLGGHGIFHAHLVGLLLHSVRRRVSVTKNSL